MVNLLVAAFIGVLIRWHFLYPIPNFNYSNWLHAHSHLNFLGWVFLGLTGLILVYFEKFEHFPHRKFKLLAWLILITNAGMLISFPIQGYGPYSISFSTLHMILGIYIFVLFLPFFRQQNTLGFHLIRWGFLFMILSGAGPLALGPLVALGFKHTQWYDFAIYLYLHFQYNGFFTLVILGLITHHLGHKHSLFLEKIRYPVVYGLVFAILFTYFLSILGSDPPLIFYLLGGLGAVVQVVIVILILITVLRYYYDFFHRDHVYINGLLIISLSCLEIKLYLQFLSGIPAIADWVFDNRNTIVAYLHFVLIGFITCFLIAWWYKLNTEIRRIYFSWSILNFLLGFAGSEITLLLYIFNVFNGFDLPFNLMILFSVFMLLGLGGIFAGFITSSSAVDTNHSSLRN
jgi:hypothetical protein